MSGMAAFSGSVTSFRPRQPTVSLHSPLDFRTGHMGLLKGERSPLGSPVNESAYGWESGSLSWCDAGALLW